MRGDGADLAGALPRLPALEHAPLRAGLSREAPVVARALVAALDLVFPALCPVCAGALGAGRRDPLCGPCWDAVERLAPPLGAPGVPGLDWARAAARYAGPLREALHALKFGGRRALARPLAELLVEQCGADLPAGVAAIVPVPLGHERERERGFNQAALLAERLGRRLALPLHPRWLVRVRPTLPQSELDAPARAANVRGAFAASSAVAGRHVLLVDDVLTTGATLGECARALAAAGAARIGALTVARVL